MDAVADRKWIRIALFYGVALALSFLARRYWHSGALADPDRNALSLAWQLVGGLGPFFGALLVWLLFRPDRRITFGGSAPAIGFAMLLVPALVLAAFGAANRLGLNPHLFGLWLGLIAALYALLEETGWRGYLQDEFRDRPPLLRYALVGLFWYVWHFSFLDAHSVGGEVAGLLLLVLASLGIGFVADRTRSIFAAASFHILGNIMGLTTAFTSLIPSQRARLVLVGISGLVCLVLLRVWRIRDNRRAAIDPAAGAERPRASR